MTVAALDGAVLMGHAPVVACRLHAAVATQPLVTPPEVVASVTPEVGEGRRQAVGPVFVRHAAQLPERVLKPAGQGGLALAAQHDLGMLPTRIDQGEVVDAVGQPSGFYACG